MQMQTERVVSEQKGETYDITSPNYNNFRALADLPNHSKQATHTVKSDAFANPKYRLKRSMIQQMPET